jgi:hypothetical protein
VLESSVFLPLVVVCLGLIVVGVLVLLPTRRKRLTRALKPVWYPPGQGYSGAGIPPPGGTAVVERRRDDLPVSFYPWDTGSHAPASPVVDHSSLFQGGSSGGGGGGASWSSDDSGSNDSGGGDGGGGGGGGGDD